MNQFAKTSNRRDVLRLGVGVSLTLTLSAVLGERPRNPIPDSEVKVVSGRGMEAARAGVGLAGSGVTSLSPTEVGHFNLVLNLEYVGAQFYSFAAGGTGLSPAMLTGIGAQGEAVGARQAQFVDPVVRRYASELANDRTVRLATMREHLVGAAAAQPTIDLSVSPTSPFSVAAHGAGLVPAGSVFDPFSGDEEFLLAAFFMENLVSAAYRSMIFGMSTDLAKQAATQNLANAIYHGGLIRAVITGKAEQNPALLNSCTSLCTYMAQLDGSRTDRQPPADGDAASSDLIDAAGRPIPFTRSPQQIMSTLYLAPGANAPGGFLPHGVNALDVPA